MDGGSGIVQNRSDGKRRDTAKKLDIQTIETIVVIFEISKTVFSFSKQLAIYPVLHPDLIASGLAWQAFMHAYLHHMELKKNDNYPNEYRSIDLSKSQILLDLAETLVMLVSFAQQFFKQGPETFSLKALTRVKEKTILDNFKRCIEIMFTPKFQEKFVRDCVITNENKLSFATGQNNQQEQGVSDLAKKFFSNFSNEIKDAELVWNNETRKELKNALEK